MKLILAILLASTCALAHGGCEDLIELSKESTAVMQTDLNVSAYAQQFCSDYASSKQNGQDISASASYKFFSGSGSYGSTSSDTIASKYCQAGNNSQAKQNVYQEYVNTIAPGAYGAYIRCKELNTGADAIQINVDKSSVLPRHFTAGVSLTSPDGKASQTLSFQASPDVECNWNIVGPPKQQITLEGELRSTALKCSRSDSTKRSTVYIYLPSKPNSQLSFVWTNFDGELPVDTLAQLRGKIDQATEALNMASANLTGAVLPFAATSCPAGWAHYTPAYGRFIRGLDPTGNIDTEKGRTFGSVQGDTFQGHHHGTVPLVTSAHGPGDQGVHGFMNGPYKTLSDTSNSIKPYPDHGTPRISAETRPVNVALLYCKRM